MLTYIKVRIESSGLRKNFGERFWTIKVDEDDDFIYAIIQNELISSKKFNHGDLIKINKKTYEIEHHSNEDIFDKSEHIYMIN